MVEQIPQFFERCICIELKNVFYVVVEKENIIKLREQGVPPGKVKLELCFKPLLLTTTSNRELGHV